jgi:hypothetical protein
VSGGNKRGGAVRIKETRCNLTHGHCNTLC